LFFGPIYQKPDFKDKPKQIKHTEINIQVAFLSVSKGVNKTVLCAPLYDNIYISMVFTQT